MTAKEFLLSRGALFEEKNIRSDLESLRELLEDFNSRVTPTLVVGGKVIAGFDLAEYEAAIRAIK